MAEQREQQARGLPVTLTDQTIENEIEAGDRDRAAARADHRRAAESRPPKRSCHRLTETQSALSEGRITYWQAATITEETRHLTD